MYLAQAVESKIGYGHVAALKIAVDARTGKVRGFAHVDFFDKEKAARALRLLRGLRLDGRELRYV